MAFRTIEVDLKANVASFSASLGAAGAQVRAFGAEATKMARASDEAVQLVSKGALVVGGAVAAGFVGAATVAGRFEKQMSAVQAVSGATASEMHRLSQAALDAGASTKLAGVSASEAAAAEAELVRAGVSVSDVVGGALMGSLALASAGQLDFASSAEIAAQAMNIFDLQGRDVTHVADVLASAANRSASDVTGLGDALRQGGLVAAQTGLSLEETVGALAAFSDQALIGSDAGTSLKTMLQRLTPQSDEAAGKMEELGFSAYDAQGNFIGLEGLAGELQSSFAGLDAESRNAALGVVFGSDAIRGANVLMSEGARGIAEYVEAVDDHGAAARMAATQVDNLAGDVEALGGAFETALIENGAKANGVLREVVQTATDMVTGFSALPDEVQSVGLGLAGIAASGAAVVGAAGIMLPKIATVTTRLQAMGAAGTVAAASIGPAFAVGGALTVGIGLFASAVGTAERQASQLVDTLTEDIDMRSVESMTAGIDEIRAKRAQLDEEWASLGQDRGGFWGDLTRGARGAVEVITPLTNSIEDNKSATEALDAAEGELIQRVERLSSNTLELMSSLGLTGEEVEKLADRAGVDLAGAFHEVVPALQGVHRGLQGGSAAATEMEIATGTLSTTVADATEKADAFDDALDALFGQFFSVEEAADSLRSEMLDLLESFELNSDGVAGNTATLDGHTEAGLRNRETVRNLIEGVYDLLAAEQRQGATSQELQAILDGEREALRGVLTQLGFNVEEVDRYVGALDQVPIDIGTEVRVSGADAAVTELDRVLAKVRELSQRANTNINITGSGQLTLADGGVHGPLPGQARIQPAGTLIQWAEPETGGEAFIPMAAAKRPRSTQILADVAGAFGFGLMPMADGGVTINMAANMDGMKVAAALRGSTTGLDPEFLRRFQAYSAEVGPLSITSGFRSSAQQAVLYARYLNGTGNLAAPPGRSKHERGLAIDHGPRSTPAMRAAATKYRLHYPVRGEPWHVEPFANGGIRGARVVPMANGGILPSVVPAGVHTAQGAGLLGMLGVATDGGGINHVLTELNRFAHGLRDVAGLTDEATKQILDSELKILGGLPVYSKAWDDRVRAIQRFEAESQMSAYELLAQRQEFEDNLHALGVSSTSEYVKQLDARIAREQLFSNEWTALVRQRAEVLEADRRLAEEDYERRVGINNNLFDLGLLTTEQHLSNLDRRLDRETKYSDEWMSLHNQRQQVLDDIARAEEDDYRDRVARNNNLFQLGKVSTEDHLANLDRRMAREVRYSDAWMSLHRQQQQVLEDVKRAEEDAARAIDDRIDSFQQWGQVGERINVGWGNSADALTRNITEQVELFTEWASELEALQARGVSGSVVEMLGLDDGPQALGQLRALTGATAEQLAALNAAAGLRDDTFRDRAIKEAGMGTGAPTINLQAQVFLGSKDITDMVKVEIKEMRTAALIAGSRG